MTQAYIHTESIETDIIGAAFGHNNRSVMSKSVRAYVHHDRTSENEIRDYGLTADQVLAEIAEGEAQGNKLHHRAKPFKNFLILFEEHHTVDDLDNLVSKITDEHPGIRPMQLALHRDEGHHDDDGNWVPNLHAHLIYTTNEKGTNKQYRLGGKKETQKLNDIAADHLGMERGKGMYEAGGRFDPAKPKSEHQPSLSHWQFRRQKMAEQEQRLELKKQSGYEHSQESEQLAEENETLKDQADDLSNQVRSLLKENSELAAELDEEKTKAKDYQAVKKAKEAEDLAELKRQLYEANKRNAELSRMADQLKEALESNKSLEEKLEEMQRSITAQPFTFTDMITNARLNETAFVTETIIEDLSKNVSRTEAQELADQTVAELENLGLENGKDFHPPRVEEEYSHIAKDHMTKAALNINEKLRHMVGIAVDRIKGRFKTKAETKNDNDSIEGMYKDLGFTKSKKR